ncbi:hypothetical protein GCM10020295_82120 [Streptomyces cinereospinus]
MHPVVAGAGHAALGEAGQLPPAELARVLGVYASRVMTPRGSTAVTGLELMTALHPATRASERDADGERHSEHNPGSLGKDPVDPAPCEAPDRDPDLAIVVSAIKATVKGGLGKLRERPRGEGWRPGRPWRALSRPTWRPDIRAAVISRTRINLHRKIVKHAAFTGQHPIAILSDCVVYGFDGNHSSASTSAPATVSRRRLMYSDSGIPASAENIRRRWYSEVAATRASSPTSTELSSCRSMCSMA